MSLDHQHFMEIALEEARVAEAEGNIPVGCVIARDGDVIVRCHSHARTSHDPTAHSETAAVSRAFLALGTPDLSACTLYTTYDPCPMCCGAMMVAKIGTLVVGSRVPDSYSPYTVEGLLELAQWGSRLALVTGILEDECSRMIEEFFTRQGFR